MARWRSRGSISTCGNGEFLSLLGPSGCGKSTALRIIAGLSEPTQGAVEWPPAAAQTASDSRIGFVFQEPTLMPWASVFNNVLAAAQAQGRPTGERSAQRVDAALERVGLQDFAAPIRANSRAACGCASRSRARWSPSRRCC